MRKAGQILFIVSLIGFLVGCTTQKRRGDYSPLGKVYHNTTARYNGYYNADVLLTESYFNLTNQHEENFNQVLPVYPYVDVDNPQSAASDLDRAIEKVTVVATLHPGSNWTDDCYLLIAKCQYLKHDYESAEETLEYMTLKFSPEAVAKREKEAVKKKVKKKDKKVKKKKKKKRRRKKKKSKPRKEKKEKTPKPKKNEKAPDLGASDYTKVNDYFMKHRPAYQEGLLWLARTYILRDRFREAETIIIELKNNKSTFKDIRRDLAVVEAHFYLTQKKYDAAVAPLERAVDLANKRVDKARYNYILGQLYQRNSENLKAYAAFSKARKFSSDYDMEFNALLNMEQTSWAKGGATPEQALNRLKRMLKDEKNTDYAGQIYYSMAKVALQAGNKAEAIQYLEESVASGSGNKSQQTESFYLLASLYFEDEDFVNAKQYYDQTLSVMPNTDERYEEVELLSKNLDEIAKNIEIITLQDSLLRISQLSDKERKDLAKKITQRRKKEQQEAEAALNAKSNIPSGANLPSSLNRNALGRGINQTTFFAYNPESLRKGKRDFERRWGVRKLEDNWRRSNRPDEDFDVDTVQVVTDANELVFGGADTEDLFKDVPSTPEEIEEANRLLEEALYQLGTLYRDKLQNNEKCIVTLEKLLARYPETNRKLEAMYYLYVSHNALGHSVQAKTYLDKICSEYPESTYCKILKDPSYAATIQTKEKQLNDFYELTFQKYQSGAYEDAYKRTQEAAGKFGNDNPLRSKFALLGAFSVGHVEGQDAYIAALKDVVAKYPNTNEEVRAKEILRFFGDSDGKEKDEGPFKIEESDKLHFCIVVIEDSKAKLNDLKVEVSDFNTKYFKLDRLRITNIFLGANTDSPILVIRRFSDKDKAMTYYQTIQKNKEDFIKKTDNYQVFVVNQHNYRQLIKQRSLEGYKEFFEKNYLESFN